MGLVFLSGSCRTFAGRHDVIVSLPVVVDDGLGVTVSRPAPYPGLRPQAAQGCLALTLCLPAKPWNRSSVPIHFEALLPCNGETVNAEIRIAMRGANK
ncbi:hypothetical protein D9X30_0874 [Cupriavidus sp. U2]|nr:hypothetical protein D9X30_0874 [Cupriavidus sp. U2]